jgi:hypothetical protein
VEISFKEVVEVVTEFTWRKFFALLVVLAILLVAFSGYERYTSSFRLSRLQKSAELIAKLQEIDLTITNNSRELQGDYLALVAQANEAITTKPLSLDILPTTLHLSMDVLWKFLAGGLVWFAFGFIMLLKMKGAEAWSALGGSSMIGTIAGFLSIWIPPIWWPWFHIFIYPIIFSIGFVLVMIPFVYVSRKIAAKKKV